MILIELILRFNSGGQRGRISARVHISCAGKLNEGFPRIDFWQWYIFLHELPCREYDEIVKAYENEGITVRERPQVYNLEWNHSGERPVHWDAPKVTMKDVVEEAVGFGSSVIEEEDPEQVRARLCVAYDVDDE